MRTIVFASHKGGCGRSTLATCLAVAAEQAGESVIVFDLDPKGCTARWSARRRDRELAVHRLVAARLPAELNAAAGKKATLALIDAPVLETPAALEAVKAADLAIVPVLPSTFDVWAAEVTGRRLSLLKQKFVFGVNQCPVRESRRKRDCISALKLIGPVLDQQIGASWAFLEAAATGRGVTEITPMGIAAREMRGFWLALRPWLFGSPDSG
ncbi:MAG: ParA family protein [Methylocapsa sp.]|nr:ParA family protein [Methylocapsa sp.]